MEGLEVNLNLLTCNNIRNKLSAILNLDNMEDRGGNFKPNFILVIISERKKFDILNFGNMEGPWR
jgi:hypothetical protein